MAELTEKEVEKIKKFIKTLDIYFNLLYIYIIS